MDSLICFSCSTTIPETSTFCLNCGIKVKCACNSSISKGAKFCSNCGKAVEITADNNEKNTFEYHRNKDEIFCKVSLTDEVGKDSIQGLIKGLTHPEGFKTEINGNKLNTYSENLNNNSDFDDAEEIEINDQSKNTSNREINNQYPHIDDLAIKINCNEAEWILIYAFYISEFAAKTFSKQAIKEKYMEERDSESHRKNFATNWKNTFKVYFATVANDKIKFTGNNLTHVTDLITGKRNGVIKNGHKRKTNKQKTSVIDLLEDTNTNDPKQLKSKSKPNNISYSLISDLNLFPSNKISLKDFYAQYNSTTSSEVILIIVHYLQKIINQSNIGVNHLYTCYKNIGLPIPNIDKALQNIHYRNGWVNTSDRSNLKINIAGENHLEHTIKKMPSTK